MPADRRSALLPAAWLALALSACSSEPLAGTGGDCAALDTHCPAQPPSYSGDVAPLVGHYCAVPGCHSPGGASPHDFTAYGGVKASAATMITQVQRCLMPPADAGPAITSFPAADRQTLLHWLVCGAPDN